MSKRINTDPIVDLIYDAVTRPELWREVVQLLATATSSNSGVFMVEKINRSAVLAHSALGVDDNGMNSLSEYYLAKDIWLEQLVDLPSNRFYRSHDVCSQKDYLNSEFYCDWGSKHNIRHAMAGYVASDGRVGVRLALQRGNREYTLDEVNLLNTLEPHFRRAAKLHAEFSDLQVLNQSTSQIVDKIPYPAFLLDENAKIFFQNEKAQDLLSTSTILSASNHHLTISQSELPDSWLDDQIKQTIQAGQGDSAIPVSRSRVLRGSDLSEVEIHISPLAVDDNRFFLQYRKVMALVFVKERKRVASLDPVTVGRLYGLTRKEANIVVLLCNGFSIDQMSDLTNTSKHTVRTHLKTVMKKLVVNSQVQLVSKVLTGVASIISDG